MGADGKFDEDQDVTIYRPAAKDQAPHPQKVACKWCGKVFDFRGVVHVTCSRECKRRWEAWLKRTDFGRSL